MNNVYQKFNGEFLTISAKNILPLERFHRLHIDDIASITVSREDLELTEAKLTPNNIKLVKLEKYLTGELL